MNYYLDTEFLEGRQAKRFLGIKYGETKPTIDLISIGIVGENGKEYYAISKDFNLKEAWNRYQYAPLSAFEKHHNLNGKKVYWIRENVLKPIFIELFIKELESSGKKCENGYDRENICTEMDYSNMEYLLVKYGKTNKKIAQEISEFVSTDSQNSFYTYYGDYDWVVFCQLYGTMLDLPNHYPNYSKDLKQILDEAGTNAMSNPESYPKQENEHNALDDAKWNVKLHNFLKSL